MLNKQQIKKAKAEAREQLKQDHYKAQVVLETKKLKARKAHIFPKRFVLQLPFRLEDWYRS